MVQEMRSVALLFGPLSSLIRGALLLLFVDNDVVRYTIQHGTGSTPEVSTLVGRMWIHAAHEKVGLYSARVEPHANIADGPTRDSLYILARLRAEERPAAWPRWVRNLWSLDSM